MKVAVASLESIAPYSQSRQYEFDVEKLQGESPLDYEKRTWRNRCHVNPEGFVMIPPTQFSGSIQDAAKYLSMPIQGKNKQTYTKNIKAGLLIADGIVLPIKLEDVQVERLSLGPRGISGTTGVLKWMPLIHQWKGELTIHVLDEAITPEVLEKHLETAGSLVGIGRFRPFPSGGYYGRFKVNKIKW